MKRNRKQRRGSSQTIKQPVPGSREIEDFLSAYEDASGHPLNDDQRCAVRHGQGPLNIMAGPGSGKSEVMVARTLKLVLVDGVNPGSVLLMTFTEKAACNLQDRITDRLLRMGYDTLLDDLRVGTLHSVCDLIMRDYRYLPYNDTRLLDEMEQSFFVHVYCGWVDEAPPEFREFFRFLHPMPRGSSDPTSGRRLTRYLERASRARLARVVERYHRFVWETALRVSGNREDAEDIAQDVFLKLLLHPPAPGSVRSPEGFLAWRVLGRASFLRRSDERRRRREQAVVECLVEGDLAPRDCDSVAREVANLPEDLRRAVELRYLGNLPVRRVAEELGLTERAVFRRLERARKLLRQSLAYLAGAAILPEATTRSGCVPPPPPQLRDDLLEIVRNGSALGAVRGTAAGQATAISGGLLMAKTTKSTVAAIVLLSLFSGGSL